MNICDFKLLLVLVIYLCNCNHTYADKGNDVREQLDQNFENADYTNNRLSALSQHEKALANCTKQNVGYIIERYKQYIKKFPDDDIAYYVLAKLYQYSGDYKSAVDNYTKGIEISPTSEDYYLNLFRTYFFNLLDVNNGEMVIKKLLNVNSKNYLGHYYLGLVYLNKGSINKSLIEIKTAAKINPKIEDNVDFHISLASIYYLSNQFQNSKYEFTQALDIDRYNLNAMKGLAAVCYAEGDIRNAINIYKFIISKYPDDSQNYYQFGRLYEKIQDFSNARRNFEIAIQLDGYTPEIIASLARMLNTENQYQAAIHLIEQYLVDGKELDTYNDSIYLSLAQAYGYMGEYIKQLDVYKFIVRKTKNKQLRKSINQYINYYINYGTGGKVVNLDNFEFKYKENINCGIACLCFMLNAINNTNATSICKISTDKYLSNQQLERSTLIDILKENHVKYCMGYFTLNGLKNILNAGYPLMLNVYMYKTSHMIVVTGYDDKFGKVRIFEPNTGIIEMSYTDLLNIWSKFDKWGLGIIQNGDMRSICSSLCMEGYSSYCAEKNYILGKYDEALMCLNGKEMNGLKYYLRGLIFENTDDDEQAIIEYLKAKRINPKLYALSEHLGDCYYKQAMWNDAIENYEAALSVDKANLEILNKIKKIYIQTRQCKKAIGMLNTINTLQPLNYQCLIEMSLMQFECGEYVESFKSLKSAMIIKKSLKISKEKVLLEANSDFNN